MQSFLSSLRQRPTKVISLASVVFVVLLAGIATFTIFTISNAAHGSPFGIYTYKFFRVTNSGVTPSGFSQKTVNITVTCPVGSYLLSGGYHLSDAPKSNPQNTNESNTPDTYPLNDRSWYFSSYYSNPKPSTFYAYANCVQTNYPVKETIVSTPLLTPDGNYTVRCPSGMISTAGGWNYHRFMIFSQPIPGGWNVDGSEKVYAVCMKLGLHVAEYTSHVTPIPPQTKATTTIIAVRCPTGQFLVGGGYKSNAPDIVFVFNGEYVLSDFSQWRVSVLNVDSVHTFNASAIAECLAR